MNYQETQQKEKSWTTNQLSSLEKTKVHLETKHSQDTLYMSWLEKLALEENFCFHNCIYYNPIWLTK